MQRPSENIFSALELWGHQRQGIDEYAFHNERLCLFWEPGTGKTAASLECLRYSQIKAGRRLRTLVLAPKSVVTGWAREMRRVGSPEMIARTLVLDGNGKERCRMFQDAITNDSHSTFITNHEAVVIPDLWRLLETTRWDMLIVDEAHRMKDPSTKRTKAVVRLADRVPRRLALTGTPVLNDWQDVWGPMRIIGADFVYANFYHFRAKYFYDRNARMPKQRHFPDWRLNPEREAELHQLIAQHSMSVKKSECLDLPPFVRQRLEVELALELQAHYASMAEDFITWLRNGEAVTASLALTKILRLQQIANGILKDEGGVTHRIKNQKLGVIEELLSDLTPQHKVIVWANFIPLYDDLREVCARLKLRYAIIRGEQGMKERQDMIDAFNFDASCRVCIANQAAGGLGIGLQAADYMIYYSKNYSLEQDLQSEARAYRGGSEVHEKVTRIDILTKDTIEEEIHEALEQKLELAQFILTLRGKDGEQTKTHRHRTRGKRLHRDGDVRPVRDRDEKVRADIDG